MTAVGPTTEPTDGLRPAPGSASARQYLRAGLPGVYRDGDFGMRFVGALELLLDPIVDTLDSLPAHLSPELAPEHLLGELASWLGLVADEGLPPAVLRGLVRGAAELTRRRGTLAGIELLLRLTFPELTLAVSDSGRVTASTGVPEAPVLTAPASLVVRSAVALTDEQRAAIARVLERERPIHVQVHLEEPPAGSAWQSRRGAA
jgi:phage tail-like protein